MKRLLALLLLLALPVHAEIVSNGASGGGSGGGGVTSFSGDGAFSNNSLSTGAVTFSLTNATAKSLWGNTSSSSGAPSYTTAPVVSGVMTAASFVPTSSTIATNGLYLSAANQLSLSTSSAAALTIGSDQGITVGSPTGGDKGSGTLNATNLYINGTAVSTSTGTVTSVGTNNGLTGGTITTTGTIGLASISNNAALCNNSGSSAVPTSANCAVTGTGNLVLAASPGLTGTPTTPTATAGTGGTQIASQAYVDNAVVASNPAIAAKIATTSASDTSGLTYNNGVSGIGATFTGTINTALTIDGVTLTTLGQRVLIKNDTQSPSGAFNGLYYLTQLQALGLPPILTRALDYDMPSDINNTGTIPIVSGTVNAGTSWLLTSTVATIGTDPLTYTQFSYAFANQAALNVANTWTALQTYTNSDFALLGSSTGKTTFTSDNAGASNFTMHVPAANDTFVDLAGSQTLTNKTLTSPALGGTVTGNNTVPLTILAQAGANTMVGNWTGSTANEAANAMPSCSDTGGNHLNYVNGTGVTCGTSGSGTFIKTIKVTTFGASGTFTADAKEAYAFVQMVGAGGGGQYATAATGQGGAGSGGGGGEYAQGLFTAATIGASQTITIGARGVGGDPAGPTNATAGGDTSIGVLMTALGGGVGYAGSHSAAPYNQNNDDGGTGGTGGDFHIAGGQGSTAMTGGSTLLIANGGAGGGSYFSPLEFGGNSTACYPTQTTAGGANAPGKGGGGSGACTSNNAATGGVGGNGTAGYVIITEYITN